MRVRSACCATALLVWEPITRYRLRAIPLAIGNRPAAGQGVITVSLPYLIDRPVQTALPPDVLLAEEGELLTFLGREL